MASGGIEPAEREGVTEDRFAIAEPVPASLARSCPRSFDCVRVAHFAQDDTDAGRTTHRLTTIRLMLYLASHDDALEPRETDLLVEPLRRCVGGLDLELDCADSALPAIVIGDF